MRTLSSDRALAHPSEIPRGAEAKVDKGRFSINEQINQINLFNCLLDSRRRLATYMYIIVFSLCVRSARYSIVSIFRQ
jgi:hypothetical protein